MKKAIILFLFIIFFSCKDDVVREYDTSGKVIKSYTIKNNKLNGVYKEFYLSGKTKLIHNFYEDKLIDSSLYFDKQGMITCKKYYKKKDTILLKFYKDKYLQSCGESTKNRKIKFWKYYDKFGNLISKKEFTNLCGKEYYNQNWDFKNNILINKSSNYFTISLEKQNFVIGETIKIKFGYNAVLSDKSNCNIYISPKVSEDFCNINDIKFDMWPLINNQDSILFSFGDAGTKHLRGYFQESLFIKNNSKNKQFLYRELYFDVKLVITDTSKPISRI